MFGRILNTPLGVQAFNFTTSLQLYYKLTLLKLFSELLFEQNTILIAVFTCIYLESCPRLNFSNKIQENCYNSV